MNDRGTSKRTGTGTSKQSWNLGLDRSEALLAEAAKFKGESLWRDAWRRLRRTRASFLCLLFLVLFGALSLFAPALPLQSPVVKDVQNRMMSPADAGFWSHEFPSNPEYWQLNVLDRGLVKLRRGIFGDGQTGHWLGTDNLGRDVLSRIVWGSRTSILAALAAALCSLFIGVTYGAFSGLMGGRVDNLMMRFVDGLYAIPFVFVVIFIITVIDSFGSAYIDREIIFYLVIGAIYWLTMARVVRGQVLSLKQSEFVEATRLLGASKGRILFHHLVPNVMSVVIVYLTLTVPAVMLFEAFLSFLGLGIAPPKVSWGLLAVDGTQAISQVRTYWWVVLGPACAMASCLLALNILGDGLRDALDPRLRGKD